MKVIKFLLLFILLLSKYIMKKEFGEMMMDVDKFDVEEIMKSMNSYNIVYK